MAAPATRPFRHLRRQGKAVAAPLMHQGMSKAKLADEPMEADTFFGRQTSAQSESTFGNQTGLSRQTTHDPGRTSTSEDGCTSSFEIQSFGVCALEEVITKNSAAHRRLVREASQREPPGVFRKTRMCRFHELGICMRGDSCDFAHDIAELHPRPDLYRTRLCVSFVRKGRCRAGESCKYAHSQAELRERSALHVASMLPYGISEQTPSSSVAPDDSASDGTAAHTVGGSDRTPGSGAGAEKGPVTVVKESFLTICMDGAHDQSRPAQQLHHEKTGLDFCVKNTFLNFKTSPKGNAGLRRPRSAEPR